MQLFLYVHLLHCSYIQVELCITKNSIRAHEKQLVIRVCMTCHTLGNYTNHATITRVIETVVKYVTYPY